MTATPTRHGIPLLNRDHPPPASSEQELRKFSHRLAKSSRLVVITVSGLLGLLAAPDVMGLITGLLVVAAMATSGLYGLWLAGRQRFWPLAVDVVLVSSLCLSQSWTVPAELLHQGTGWVRPVVSITVIAYQWHTTPRTGAVATIVLSAAYVAGVVLPDDASWMTASWRGTWLLIEAGLSRMLWLLVRRGGRQADDLHRRSAAIRHRQAVERAGRAERRAYLAALHDTAAATLLMVDMGVVDTGQTWLRDQARRDLEVLSGQMREGTGEIDLVKLLKVSVRECRMHIELAAPEPLTVPLSVAHAICGCVHEALLNVSRHAGVDSASVRATRMGNGVLVEVIDDGRGFQHDRVSRQHHGLSLSIHERIAGIGGSASVRSAPGQGTCVRLRWSDSPGQCDAVPSGPERSSWERRIGLVTGLRTAACAITVAVILTGQLVTLISHAARYPSLAVQVVAYVVTVCAAICCAAGILRGSFSTGARWALLVVVSLATLVSAVVTPPGNVDMAVHWGAGNLGWFAIVLFMGAALSRLLVVLSLDFLLESLVVMVREGPSVHRLIVIITANVVICATQLAVALASQSLNKIADAVKHAAQEEEQARAELAISEKVAGERQARYSALTKTMIPLLSGLATGSLDPTGQDVRRSCTIEAARIRRLIAEHDEVSDPLVHELLACIDVAERRGVSVFFATCGRPSALPRKVRRELTEPALEVLTAAVTTARVTVVGSPQETRVSVVTDAQNSLRGPCTHTRVGEVTVSYTTGPNQLWVEAIWRAEE